MKRILFWILAALAITACSDEMPVAMDQVGTFSRQLIGEWELESVDIIPARTGKAIGISPSKEFACNQLSATFEARDVVSRFCFQFNNDQLKVTKYYTCSLPPEQLAWKLELDETGDKNANWVSGNTFIISEINEGNIQAKYKLTFFNLTSNSPDGEVATGETSNTMTLDVKYDTKESSKSFKLKLRKRI